MNHVIHPKIGGHTPHHCFGGATGRYVGAEKEILVYLHAMYRGIASVLTTLSTLQIGDNSKANSSAEQDANAHYLEPLSCGQNYLT